MPVSPSWSVKHESALPEVGKKASLGKHTRARAARTPPPGGMGMSWRLCKVAGIGIYIHVTFPFLIFWIGMMHAMQGSTMLEAIAGIAFVLMLFVCVVLHEYGHALVARRFGIRTRDITLLPIGGVARLERIPKKPYQELLVALAGPAVNVLIAGALLGWLWLAGNGFQAFDATLIGTGSNPVAEMMYINLWLAGFNLLPAFPMDGGRVLRALLAMKIARLTATRIACRLGQGLAIVFGILGSGLLGVFQPFLLLIALFVYFAAVQEYESVRWETAVENLTVADAMVTQFRALWAEDPLSRAAGLLVHGDQHDFPVLDDEGNVAGVLLHQDLITALGRENGEQTPVLTVMRQDVPLAYASQPLTAVVEKMQAAQIPVLPVLDDGGKLAGLLTANNVAEVVMVRRALEKSHPHNGAPASSRRAEQETPAAKA